MLKKHLVIIALVFGLVMMVKVFAYRSSQTKNVLKVQSAYVLAQPEKKTVSDIVHMEFANETLPLGDAKVVAKMQRNLYKYSYSQVQTHRLHLLAQKWFPMIEPVLEKYGIPNDFKYIPLVESGFLQGVSIKGAAGNWQFMPATARALGLRVDGNVDERYDMRKSTEAACKYFKTLYKEFQSWTLVAAAYNVGNGHLQKKINQQNTDNYFRLKLNQETGKYVYSLISIKQILEHPEKYGYNKRYAYKSKKSGSSNQNQTITE